MADVIKTHKFRGFVIHEIRNRKNKRIEFKTRFQISGKRHYLTNNNRKDLEEAIDEIVYNSRRAASDLPVKIKLDAPTIEEIFARVLPTIEKRHQRTIAARVFNKFLVLLPEGLTAPELKKSHYQMYIDFRRAQKNVQSKTPITLDTVYKELYVISSAFSKADLYFPALENWTRPPMPRRADKNGRQAGKRTRVVAPETELKLLLDYLRANNFGRVSAAYRIRLADELEFKTETGLRRKEVARLETNQYKRSESALLNVRRWKTGTVTKFFPLSRRACEIIESRIADNPKYIFSEAGEPSESDYRTLKIVCRKIKIPYGRYSKEGFVMHDLRRNYATNLLEHTDVKTIAELLGHSTTTQTETYLQTNEKRMIEAVRKSDGIDLKAEINKLYEDAISGNLTREKFAEIIEKMIKK